MESEDTNSLPSSTPEIKLEGSSTDPKGIPISGKINFFNLDFGDGPVPVWRDLEIKASKEKNLFVRFLYTVLAALIKQWFPDLKTSVTMWDVDRQIEALHDQWDIEEAKAKKPILTETEATEASSDAAKALGFEELRLSAPYEIDPSLDEEES